MSRARTVALVCAAAVVFLAVVVVSIDRSATGDEEPAARPTTTTPVTATDEVHPPDTVVGRGPCEAHQELADVDGDGTADQIAPDFVDGQGLLVICLSTGAVVSAPAPPAESMAVVDLDGDGTAEVAVGQTLIQSAHLSVFSLVGGSLEQVLLDDGEPLLLEEGNDIDPVSSAVTGRWGWGCRDDADGRRVVLARADADAWTAEVVAVDGAVATVVGSEGGDAPNGEFPTDIFGPCS